MLSLRQQRKARARAPSAAKATIPPTAAAQEDANDDTNAMDIDDSSEMTMPPIPTTPATTFPAPGSNKRRSASPEKRGSVKKTSASKRTPRSSIGTSPSSAPPAASSSSAAALAPAEIDDLCLLNPHSGAGQPETLPLSSAFSSAEITDLQNWLQQQAAKDDKGWLALCKGELPNACVRAKLSSKKSEAPWAGSGIGETQKVDQACTMCPKRVKKTKPDTNPYIVTRKFDGVMTLVVLLDGKDSFRYFV